MSTALEERKPSLFYHNLGSETRLEVTVPVGVELRDRSGGGGDFDLLSQKLRDALFAATKLGAEVFTLVHLRTHAKTNPTDKTPVDMIFACDPESIPHVESELQDNRADWEIKFYKSSMGPFDPKRKDESSSNDSDRRQ